MEAISISDSGRWNQLIFSFYRPDIYYRAEYVSSLLTYENADAVLLSFKNGDATLCYPMLIHDVADDKIFGSFLPHDKYYDMEVPYGYGGPLYQNITDADLLLFKAQLQQWAYSKSIVSQFVRFNPMSNNAVSTKSMFDIVRYVHHTIYIDTSIKEIISRNMDAKNRNVVRKAQKNDVRIVFDKSLERITDFISIYKSTMDYHKANEDYYFPDAYYSFIKNEFIEHTTLLYAEYGDKMISASLFLYDKDHIHYHLSGTIPEYRHLASANLLLYEAACWACDNGISEFHLGGGLQENDSLFGFKKQFNKNGLKDFYIGRSIFDSKKYAELLELRRITDSSFNTTNNRMIQYRG